MKLVKSHLNSSLLFTVITPFLSLLITIIYIKIFIYIFKYKKNNSIKKKIIIKWSIFILTLSNIIIWFPFSILCILSLFLKIHFSKLFYDSIIVLIIPFNSILNPILFIISDFKIKKKIRKK